ncbi:MAG: hypothetical protein AB7O52_16345 [Planctomycetota bacterium]
MSVLALVPARGGSQGIPRKNIRSFCGQPLISWCLAALEDARLVDRVVVATDDAEIADTVLTLGLEKPEIYWRAPENATHEASTESLLLEYLGSEFGQRLAPDDDLLLVQATSPFTRAIDFDSAISHYHRSDADSLLSCVRLRRFLWREDGTPINYDYRHRPRRQDFTGTLLENGAFYLNSVTHVRAHGNRLYGRITCYELPEWTAIELDEPSDWTLAEALFEQHRPQAETTR